jgi:hypothetical protein
MASGKNIGEQREEGRKFLLHEEKIFILRCLVKLIKLGLLSGIPSCHYQQF